jgi:hypothetical protein
MVSRTMVHADGVALTFDRSSVRVMVTLLSLKFTHICPRFAGNEASSLQLASRDSLWQSSAKIRIMHNVPIVSGLASSRTQVLSDKPVIVPCSKLYWRHSAPNERL